MKFVTVPRSKKEVLEDCLKITNQTKNYNRHIEPLLDKGLLERTKPDNPKDRNQKYVITEKGKRLINSVK